MLPGKEMRIRCQVNGLKAAVLSNALKHGNCRGSLRRDYEEMLIDSESNTNFAEFDLSKLS